MINIDYKKEREGQVFINKLGTQIKVINYIDCENVEIEFIGHNYKSKTYWSQLKKGNVISPYDKTQYNIGYLGEGIYSHKSHPKIYNHWHDMIRRCYSEEYLSKHPTYIGCTVCEEWHNFQNFAQWYEEYYYEVPNETMCLDKDILIKGNKEYNPETCIFVPHKINSLFTKTNAKRGSLPIGISLKENKYIVQIQKNKRVHYLGSFNNINDAFNTYKNYKEDYIKYIANEYQDIIPDILYQALYLYEVEIND